MFRKRVLVMVLSCLLEFLISLLFIEDNTDYGMLTRMITISTNKTSNYVDNEMKVVEVDTKDGQVSEKKDTNTGDNSSNVGLVNLNMVEAKKAAVYDGMTVEELASKLDRSLKNELSGKGYLYASY